MSFSLSALIVLAVVAVGLGLVCYHLLGRLEMLERAVQGGLEPPTTRLSREQFERRFRTAHARSGLARQVGTGVVLVVGAEHRADNALVATIDHLARPDRFEVRPVDELDAEHLGVTTTPYLFIVDEYRVRHAQPVAGPDDLVDALKRFT